MTGEPPSLSRRRRLAETGWKAFERMGAENTNSKRLVAALAAMLDEALPPTRKKQKSPLDETVLPFTPKQVYDELEKHCADIIELKPYQQSSFGVLGRSLKRCQGLDAGDLSTVVGWIQSGGLSSWPTTPTWAHVTKHFVNWVAQARRDGGRAKVIGPGPLVFR